ncbi:class I SAM-dependent methyltransferase [Synechococcus sp. UW179A]|uniref:class I SAM-dependent methyltransferase n=1 Tax=Synechococcus sp. UW179A TaxID=2575510 RepID=UPI000E0EF98B|nr:class I SAM-dependent methyltransferase [Synechococcus sp. UW179A]
MTDYNFFDHDTYARSRPKEDFWGQIKRTVRGEPADENQIKFITKAITNGLKLERNDNIIDFCCGNGALSSRLKNSVSKLKGIDNSEYLISIAKEFFEESPDISFMHSEIIDFLNSSTPTEASKYSKSLCYGSFSYLEQTIIDNILDQFNLKFKAISRFYIGNIPDRSRADVFFKDSIPQNADLASCKSVIGKWWTKSEIRALSEKYNWEATIIDMPEAFYASAYRFDVILSRDV